MKTMALAFLALALPAQPAQVPKQPAKDLFMHSMKAPGFELRFVDYHWQPALFDAMEKGSRAIPEATRNWVIARIILDNRPLTLGDKRLPVGNYALVLWPNLDGKGMAVEMRRVDMREVYPDVNAMAPAPRGETVYKGPAKFETTSPLAPRFDATLSAGADTVDMGIRYGDRRLVLHFVR
jgi:hypothetical protein